MYAETIIPRYPSKKAVFTYHVPEPLKQKAVLGAAVKIPLRNRTEIGIIRHLHEEKPAFSTKDIAELFDKKLQPWQIKLAEFIAEYYFCSLGKAIKTLLPPKFLSSKNYIKKHKYIKLKTNLEEIKTRYPKIEKQNKIYELLEELSENDETDLSSLIEQKRYSRASINSLLKKDITEIIEKKIIAPIATSSFKQRSKADKILTDDQKIAFDTIINEDQQSFLLHGITSSGKTEIFLHLARYYRTLEKQILILVPEIGLTPQLIEYFIPDFYNEIAIIHSKISAQEKIQEFARISAGEASIVIGSRSAIFAPFKNLGLIIMDEEHEWTYKQDKAPRYNTKTIIQQIAKLLNCKIVYSSATPSIETYFEAKQGHHIVLNLTTRIHHGNQDEQHLQPPKCQIVDLRQELRKGNYSIFSDMLIQKLTETLQKGKQAIFFINRRGYSASLLCRDCGKTIQCSCSNIPMVAHKNVPANLTAIASPNHYPSYLLCHYCGQIKDIPLLCPHCSSPRIKNIGIGTEKVESELQKLFPGIKTLRADRDTIHSRASYYELYKTFKEGKADILIGTQMVTKGLDIPLVHLVAVMLADIGLHLPNFRNQEKIFQILTQVIGRSGRRNIQGEAIIQTYNPDNPAIQASCKQDYTLFYEKEINIRKNMNYSPYSKLINIQITHKDPEKAFQESKKLENSLISIKESHKNEEQFSQTVIFQAPALPFKNFNKYRYNILLKGPNPKILLENLDIQPKWKVDVDPI